MIRRWKLYRLRRQLNRPAPSLQTVVRRLRAHLEDGPRSALALVEVSAAEPAAIALAVLAAGLASEGKQVTLVDAADGRPLRRILRGKGGPGRVRTVTVRGQPVKLFVAPDDPISMGNERVSEDADVTLVLATIDPALGADHLAGWAGKAVVMIKAGEATKARIDGIARHLRHARIAILSGVLIGADPYDHSSGFPPTLASSTESGDRLPETLKVSAR